MCRYIIISPVKNEEEYIETTITSMKNQKLQPLKWVIVNDGSTDKTKEIIELHSKDYNRIVLLDRKNVNDKRKRGKGVVEAFYDGFELIKNLDFDFIVKLDGDLKLDTNFFEKIIDRFDNDPKLGIASGVSYIQKRGKWVPERASKGFTYGETKVYRKRCFEEIGGIVPSMGWDGIDHIKAVMHGWKAIGFDDIIFYHLRPQGKGTGRLKAAYEEGICCYFMGYHPLFFILRSFKIMMFYPFIIGGLAMIFSYLKCTLRKERKINDKDFIKFLRKIQITRILHRRSEYVFMEN